MELQEIADRLEIQDLLIDYCTAVDQRDFDAFDSIFTPQGRIDYTAMGGSAGSVQEMKSYLQKALGAFPASQHLIANVRIRVFGDQAEARCVCHNPMVFRRDAKTLQVMFYGLWYVDRLVRTPQGWRIHQRRLERCYDFNVPEDFRPAGSSTA